jgi:hypothetical protein
MGDYAAIDYIPRYLKPATARISEHLPLDFGLNVNDTYGIQEICAYEVAAFGSSDFCGLFTLEEWEGFEYSTDLAYYGDYSFGNPTGRAQGIGYVQEILARLMNQTITTSNSSVNSTLDSDPSTFPLGQPFYLDMTHDDILMSVVTALSIEYFKEDMSTSAYPPNPDRHFMVSHLTPFGTRLETEVLGCTSATPEVRNTASTIYSIGQNGYKPAHAPHKFIRIRWNNGILPLDTVPGGFCTRSDGLCPLDRFIQSQASASELANYQYACFGNWTLNELKFVEDGNIFA